VKPIRRLVVDLMVFAHRIPHELADRHVAEMDDAELHRRIAMYQRQGGAPSEVKRFLMHVRSRIPGAEKAKGSL